MSFFPLKILLVTGESAFSQDIFRGLSQSDSVFRISLIPTDHIDWNELQALFEEYNRVVFVCSTYHSIRDHLYIPLVLAHLSHQKGIHFSYVLLENKPLELPDFCDFATQLISEMDGQTLILRFRKLEKIGERILPTLLPLMEDILIRGYTGEFLMVNSAEESPRLYTLYPGRLD